MQTNVLINAAELQMGFDELVIEASYLDSLIQATLVYTDDAFLALKEIMKKVDKPLDLSGIAYTCL
jgi:hypothetical protein